MQTKFKKLVDDICRQENLNHSNLSEFIYKSRNYIGRLYRDGSSDENIEKAIMLLERLNIKIEPTELDLVKAENEMLRKQDSYRVQVLDKRNDLLENCKFENEQLENTVKHLQTVLNERTSELELSWSKNTEIGKRNSDLKIDVEKLRQYSSELFNEQSVLKHQLSETERSMNHYISENSKLQTVNSNLLSEVSELSESVEYWSSEYYKSHSWIKFLGWCILALLIVIGVVWLK